MRLPERDRPLAGAAPVVYTVGASGRNTELFGQIAGVAFGPGEHLFVLDRVARRVTEFDAAGRFVRHVGRPGNGPGELIVPIHLDVSAEGTLVVTDAGRFAFATYGPDGAFRRFVPMNAAFPVVRPVVSSGSASVLAIMRPLGEDGPRGMLPLVSHPLGSGVPARLLYAVPRRMAPERTGSAEGGITISRTVVFAPPLLLSALPRGETALAFTSGYTIRILDDAGQTVRYLQRPMRVRRTTQGDRERVRNRQREDAEAAEGPVVSLGGVGVGALPPGTPLPASLDEQLRHLEFADTIPALQGMRTSPSGTIWIERTPADVGEPGPIDLVRADGTYLGSLTGFRLPDAISRGGRAAHVERDEDGVQRVVVRALPATWR